MKKNRVKKPHFIPRESYLKQFSNSKAKIQAYLNKELLISDSSKASPIEVSPANFCIEHYMYETPRLPVNTMEKLLEKIEREYLGVLRNKILKKKKLSVSDKEKVSYFISTLESRTPSSRENIHGFIDRVLSQFESLEKQFNKGVKTKQHLELEKIKEDKSAFVQSILTSAQVNRWRISDYAFLFTQFEGDDQFFVTSDFPVTIVDFTLMNSFYGVPPLSTTIEVTIPLTSNITLFINNAGFSGYYEINHNFVREINNRTLIGVGSYIISPKKLDDRFIDYNLRRFRQSLLLFMLDDEMAEKWKQRMNKKKPRKQS